MSGPTAPDRASRRSYGLAVVGGIAAGGLTFFAATRTWAAVTVRTPGLPTDQVTVDGRAAVPLVAALALVVMAGSVAVLASRGRVRVAVGGVVVLAALGAAIAVVTGGAGVTTALVDALGQSPAMAGDRGTQQRLAADADTTIWRWVALLGAVLSLAVGVTVTRCARRWPVMGGRYENPATQAEEAAAPTAEPTETDIWKALDRGEDPTA
ncbi:Trp biosynthesis-associated membrane protein [Solicola sp. PLA-1-18]|uniref:Trp biosynthesis-associated membrane protein n=1 Tax=Solicola sp. PLA-1-18 TaxID=3380532 RepID=UPI003B7A76DA